ncbi:MAG TPA: hypothetical protein VG939_01135 [Caulobacteraceae bacterium]|nr:hypothetical protein [Caulobacteraceae bacterium]
MRYASLVAIVSGTPDDEAVIVQTCELVRRHAARARILVAVPTMVKAAAPVGIGSGLLAAQAWTALDDSRRRVVEHVRGLAAEHTARLGLAAASPGETAPVTIAAEAATPWLGLQQELPLADLVIIGRSSARGDGPWTGVLSDVLMTARAPVLVVRDDRPVLGQPVAIAWDGSLEAGRAVRAALPLLAEAPAVIVLQDPDELGDAAGAVDPERLTAYLDGHGVKPVKTVRTAGAHAGPALVQGAVDAGAAVLVAGAYGHARLREAVLGGATRTFLEAPKGPHLLLCH